MKCDEVSRLLKALAEPTRLRLVCLLARYGTICVCELTEITELPQYHVSRHLGMLRNLGLVADERDGARVNYKLAGGNDLLAQLTDVLATAIESCPRARQDLQRAAMLVGGRR
ncbi:MAG: transcriptional regulator [Armatimonadetes bacterium CG_4_10_14_3_um_filter_66_18]|nr:winged helix-turn-helix transcriptional regulator [Armatimonadota bacterium]OIP04900.1 MAG: hypothetical protein AUJ96_11785 [Armatimonadetes bacterium CG2_30_66_41]PIU87722.1 MAG: transcriptional regulator [Armatimonadetes bacterium CG06_land_8_20_14_3_00_66_21]PIX47842.1 MAG: transcriptional regulator [Armatimonadetes bacterium CG_4_8_14_3_um_filter_66_20]PIY42481.1 MAG: transcriptional regulator [Armatimonadetes bacterium CG_4_10_14_3_um_filter_66_18]PIZ49138.1 MAG: transcriptional regul